MTDHKIGTREEWLAAREPLLVREKEHTRVGDELARQRRELPWVRVEKEYRFDTDDGEQTLVELFDGRSQLLVYHFMFGPSYEAGCPVCSSIADGVDGLLPHLHARDVTFAIRLAGAAGEAAGLQARAWAGAFPGSRPRAPTSTSTSASRAREEQTREWVAPMAEAGYRRSSSTTPARRAPTSLATSREPWVQHVRHATTAPSTTPTRRRGAEWSFSWATTRSSTAHRRAATRARRGSSGSAGTTSTRAVDAGFRRFRPSPA